MKIFLLLILFQVNTFGAACCGGSSALPSLITGDNGAQFSVAQSLGKVVGRTYAKDQSVFYADSKKYQTLTTSFKGAYLLSPLFQIGGGISLIHKDNSDKSVKESKTLLGDADLSITYEYLPEKFYSAWKPRGFIYFKQTFPTGKSNYETTTTLLTDVSGKGQYSSALGLVFSKIFKSIDWQIFSEYRHLYKDEIGKTSIAGSSADSQGFSIGYSPNNGAIRTSIGITRNHYSDKEITINNLRQNSNREEYWDFELGLAYMINDSTFNLSYIDQTILGSTENTTLSRTIAISWLERWPL